MIISCSQMRQTMLILTLESDTDHETWILVHSTSQHSAMWQLGGKHVGSVAFEFFSSEPPVELYDFSVSSAQMKVKAEVEEKELKKQREKEERDREVEREREERRKREKEREDRERREREREKGRDRDRRRRSRSRSRSRRSRSRERRRSGSRDRRRSRDRCVSPAMFYIAVFLSLFCPDRKRCGWLGAKNHLLIYLCLSSFVVWTYMWFKVKVQGF